MRIQVTLYLLALTALAATPAAALGCPDIDGLPDMNCDGRLRIAITGDSIVKGVFPGGTDERIAYPRRLQQLYRNRKVKVQNIGVSGIRPNQLLDAFKRNIDRDRTTNKLTRRIDIFGIAVGTNAYWDNVPRVVSDELHAARVVRDIRRLQKFLGRKIRTKWGSKPYVYISTITSTGRSFQQPFVDRVNRLLLARKKRWNVDVPFHRLGTTILSEDALHPDVPGYKRMAKFLKRRMDRAIQRKAHGERHDLDLDGLYDEVEFPIFACSQENPDTDGDTLFDGDEVFLYRTSPTTADSDGDTFSDGDEVLAETDPNDPLSFPDPVEEPEEEVVEEEDDPAPEPEDELPQTL